MTALLRSLAHSRHDNRWLVALLVAGIVVRLVGWAPGSLTPRTAETQRIAVALLTTGNYADAFGPDTGLTAHVMPVMPLVIAGVYRLFGIGTPAAELALSALAAGLAMLAAWFCFQLFGALGASRRARFAALAVVALLPLQFAMEVRELKVWDGPLAVAVLCALLLMVVQLDQRGRLSFAALLPSCLVAAVLALISPTAALAGYGAVALLALRRLPVRLWPLVAGALVAATILVCLPWALRNQAALGAMIWTRSNPNLELALAYSDTINDTPDRRQGYLRRIDEISPIAADGRGLAAMRAAGGEIAYNAQLGTETRDWISRHPEAAAGLVIRHVRQYLWPPAWQFSIWGEPSTSAPLRGACLALSLLAAIGSALVLAWRRPSYIYVLAALLLLIAPYVIFQPILRYRYLVYTLSLFIAADGVARLAAQWRNRRTPRLLA